MIWSIGRNRRQEQGVIDDLSRTPQADAQISALLAISLFDAVANNTKLPLSDPNHYVSFVRLFDLEANRREGLPAAQACWKAADRKEHPQVRRTGVSSAKQSQAFRRLKPWPAGSVKASSKHIFWGRFQYRKIWTTFAWDLKSIDGH